MAYNHRQTGDSTLTLFLKRLGSIERSWDSFVGNLTHNSWFYIYFIAAPLKGRNTDFIKGHFAVAYRHKFPVFTLFVMVKCHLGSSIIIHCFSITGLVVVGSEEWLIKLSLQLVVVLSQTTVYGNFLKGYKMPLGR